MPSLISIITVATSSPLMSWWTRFGWDSAGKPPRTQRARMPVNVLEYPRISPICPVMYMAWLSRSVVAVIVVEDQRFVEPPGNSVAGAPNAASKMVAISPMVGRRQSS